MGVSKVSDSDFEAQVLKSTEPVVVDFWAEWCGPCKMIAPALEELAEQLKGRLTIAKINIDHNPQTPKKYGVRGIPSLNSIKVGIDMIPYLAAVPGFSSTLSLTILTLSPSDLEISSSAGAIMRHGPHHSAQKSTTTGPLALITSLSNVASVTLSTIIRPRCSERIVKTGR